MNFIFHKKWLEDIENYRKDFGDKYATELTNTIIYYGIKGKIISKEKTIIDYINKNVIPLMENSL